MKGILGFFSFVGLAISFIPIGREHAIAQANKEQFTHSLTQAEMHAVKGSSTGVGVNGGHTGNGQLCNVQNCNGPTRCVNSGLGGSAYYQYYPHYECGDSNNPSDSCYNNGSATCSETTHYSENGCTGDILSFSFTHASISRMLRSVDSDALCANNLIVHVTSWCNRRVL